MTTMARAAATEHGADWVLLSDGDELWWPRGGSLRDVLAEVPQRYGIVRAISRYFVPRPDDDRSFAERMTFRLTPRAPINDPATPFRPVAKLAHRAHPGVVVGNGNHAVSGIPLVPLEAWTPIELLHFPLRSAAQCARKYREDLARLAGEPPRGHRSRPDDVEEGAGESFFERVVVDDAALERGLAEGSLVRDTALPGRASDARRSRDLQRGRASAIPAAGRCSRLVFPSPTLDRGQRVRSGRCSPARGERRSSVPASRRHRTEAGVRRPRMKVVMTMLVRDEEDILDAQLAFHLNAGIDFVIATDHRSQDGTTEILERYAREGCSM